MKIERVISGTLVYKVWVVDTAGSGTLLAGFNDELDAEAYAAEARDNFEQLDMAALVQVIMDGKKVVGEQYATTLFVIERSK